MDPKDRRVKIGQEEIERLLNLKSQVDHKETVWRYAEEYQKLGWVLQGVSPQDGTDLEVDFEGGPGNLDSSMCETGLSGPEVNWEVYTGKQSGLMVLEVSKGPGESILDQFGDWRAECIAALGAVREQHFYAWDPSPLFDAVSCLVTPEISWFGEGHVVPVPPSFDAERQETWRWVCPPWEKPPQCPSQPLSRFLQQHLTREPQSRPEVSLSWQEVYCLVSPFETLLQALSSFVCVDMELLPGDPRCGGGGGPEVARSAPVVALARPPGEGSPTTGNLGLPAEIGGRVPRAARHRNAPGKCPLGSVSGKFPGFGKRTCGERFGAIGV